MYNSLYYIFHSYSCNKLYIQDTNPITLPCSLAALVMNCAAAGSIVITQSSASPVISVSDASLGIIRVSDSERNTFATSLPQSSR